MNAVLDARQLSYGTQTRRRVDALDVQLGAGDRLGLLGVNGAGKSTLLQLLAGVLAPHAGVVSVMGRTLTADDIGIRRHIGFMPQRVPLYGELSVHENLAWAGRLRQLTGQSLHRAIAAVLARVQLDGVSQRLAGQLSAGMVQRLGLAQALIHEPSILILDEPTAGLDPLQTENIRDLLKALPADCSVILATHLLDDVQQLCDRVILLDAGRKAAEHAVTDDSDLLAHFRNPSTGVAAS